MRGSKREIRRGVWELRVSIGRDATSGRYRTISRTVRGSAGAANEALRDLIAEQADVPDEGRKATVATLFDRWLEECERLDLSPTTIRNYRSQIDCRLRPELGALRLTSLTASEWLTLAQGAYTQAQTYLREGNLGAYQAEVDLMNHYIVEASSVLPATRGTTQTPTSPTTTTTVPGGASRKTTT